MKRFSAVTLSAAILGISLSACSNLPNKPAETYTSECSYVDPSGMTVKVSNPDTGKTEIQGVETVCNIELVFEDYYVYGSSVAKITNVEIEDLGIGNSRGFADVEMISVGSRKSGMRIAYTAYDKDGNILRNSYILTILKANERYDKVNDGDVIEGRRFDVPKGTVKVVFSTYTED